MKIRRIIACMITVMLAVVCMAGCGNGVTAEENEALHQQLMGSWVPLVDPNLEYDEEGKVSKFTVYEFTENETRYHVVEMERTGSELVNNYTISDGKYKVITETGAQFAIIEFTESGNLLWKTDSSTDEFRPLTAEEIEQFGVPVDRPGLFEDAIKADGIPDDQTTAEE